MVCELVASISDYEGVPRLLDVAMVDRVASIFFTHGSATPAAAVRSAA